MTWYLRLRSTSSLTSRDDVEFPAEFWSGAHPDRQGRDLGLTQCASVTKMIDAVVSSSDAVAAAAGAGKFPPGGPTRIRQRLKRRLQGVGDFPRERTSGRFGS